VQLGQIQIMSKIMVAFLNVAGAELYCPDQNSWYGIGGSTWWNGNGWTIKGGGGVHGKTSFNLLGGYIEFDVDNSGAQVGVNNNFYTISPDHPYTSYQDYCDGQGPEASSPTGTYCMEMDIYEANGNQQLQTTWHTWFNRNGDCDMNGCWAGRNLGGKFHVKVEFGTDGWMHTYFNNEEINNFTPWPSNNARDSVRDTMNRVGVAFQSTQWTGWVPGGSPPGDLANSQFSITNLKVSGSIKFGPEPPKCSGPSPSPTPSPSPSGGCCSWGGGCDHHDAWCDASSGNCEGACKGQWVTGGCCSWGGGCDHHDAWCDASSGNCEGACKGQWVNGYAILQNSTTIQVV